MLDVAVNPEVLFEPLVGAFQLPIRLWVICSGNVLYDVQLFAQFRCEVQCKVYITIGDNLGGNPKVWEDMLCIECCDPLTGDGLVAWEKQ